MQVLGRSLLMTPMPCALERGMGAARGMRDKTLHILCVHGPAKLSLGSQQMERTTHLRQQVVGFVPAQNHAVDSWVQDGWIHPLEFNARARTTSGGVSDGLAGQCP